MFITMETCFILSLGCKNATKIILYTGSESSVIDEPETTSVVNILLLATCSKQALDFNYVRKMGI